MKNYLRHNFRRPFVFGRSRISILGTQDINNSTVRNVFSGYIPEKNQRPVAPIEQIKEKEWKSGWLNSLFMNRNGVNILKGGLLENEYVPLNNSFYAFQFGSTLKKNFSECNFFDRNKISCNNENFESRENTGVYDSIKCKEPIEKHKLFRLDSIVPIVSNCSHNAPCIDWMRSRSHSNLYLRTNSLMSCNEVPVNDSRSFTTLSTKTECIKTATPEPSNVPCNLQHPGENGVLMDDRRQETSTATDDPSAAADRINLFSSECKCNATIKPPNAQQMKKSEGLDNLFCNHNERNAMIGSLLEDAPIKHSSHPFNKFDNRLKKYFSDCNFLNKDSISNNKKNHNSVENVGLYDFTNSVKPSKKLNLTNEFNSFAPTATKCSNPTPYFDCKRPGNQSNRYLRNNFLGSCNVVSINSSRSFTTLRSKSESSKTIILDPLNAQRLGNKADSRQIMSKATERDSGIFSEKLKKRDLDWINSFSSEAVILQPSRGEFSIKKLINKTACQERLWGLPDKQTFAKTTGPRMNDNLIQYMSLKHKMDSEFKKNNFIGEGAEASRKVKMLIKSAEEKNRQNELKKPKKVSTKSRARKMLKTIKQSINLKPIEILKMKEETAKKNETRYLQKAQHKKRSILNIRLPSLKVQDTPSLLQKEIPPKTEYQSSASYKQVFQEIFNKANKTKLPSKPAIPLSVFNRQVSQIVSRSVNKLSSDNSIRNKKVLKKKEKSSTFLELNNTGNLKNQSRTPFQKPSNTQLTSKSKASFSTVSKIPKTPGFPIVSSPNLLRNTGGQISTPKVKTTKRSICTNLKVNEGNQPVIKKSLYSTLGYLPAVPKRMVMKPKKKLKNITHRPKKNETKLEFKSHTRPSNPNSGYFNQRRSLSSFGVLVGNMMESDGSLNTLTEPLNEQIFKEVMNLCKVRPEKEKNVVNSEKEKKLKEYGKCSLQEKKKPERRRGFVCRVASMLNIGCGRRRRHNQGCTECGKKAG